MTTRRTCLAGALATAIVTLPSLGSAQDRAVVIGAIRVDVSRLTTQGWGANAMAIKLGLERELTAALGDRLRRGAGPTLTVTVRQVFLNSYAGGGGGGGGRFGGGGSSSTSDYLDSEAVLVDRGNRVLATYPVLSAVPAAAAGPWYLPDIDQRRLDGLLQHNAAWIKRYVAG